MADGRARGRDLDVLNDTSSMDASQLRDLLAAVMQDNADGILVVDEDGQVIAANDTAATLLGQQKVVGEPFGLPVIHGQAAELEVIVDGEVHVIELRAAETSLGDRPAHVATLRDVTKRKQVEQSLQDFVSMTSHEFRTPLTAITGFARTLIQTWDHADDETKLSQLEIILRQGTRLARLTHDLLAISQLDADAVQPLTEQVDVAAVVDEALMILDDDLAETDVDISAVEAVVARCDSDHLQEMLINLLSNAYKYGRDPLVVSAQRVDDVVEVRVRDHGEGVDDELRPRLFERYERTQDVTHRRRPGTGLGLAIVRGLAERNGGSVRYEDADEGGAVFVLTLPA